MARGNYKPPNHLPYGDLNPALIRAFNNGHIVILNDETPRPIVKKKPPKRKFFIGL